jgi:hypothetical protein
MTTADIRQLADMLWPNWNAAMSRTWRYVVYVYAAGALVMEIDQILQAHESGGFQRRHSIVAWIITAALHLAFDALWPFLVVILILVYFGVLPGGIWDLF